MNDAEYAAQVARLERLAKRWVEPLGLTAWKLNYDYVRGDFTNDGEPAPGTMATAKTHSEYMLATISWNMPVVAEHDDRELERIFLHEFMHVMVNEMRPTRAETDYDKALSQEEKWHEERTSTMLGNAFLWTREAVLREARGEPILDEY